MPFPELTEREREILLMRFYGEHTQSEIADRLGLHLGKPPRPTTTWATAMGWKP